MRTLSLSAVLVAVGLVATPASAQMTNSMGNMGSAPMATKTMAHTMPMHHRMWPKMRMCHRMSHRQLMHNRQCRMMMMNHKRMMHHHM